MDILYSDRDIIVCIKPSGILSTDEPGGLPQLVREELGDPSANVRTVHRLDRVVSGIMVLARRAKAASELSRQMRDGMFHKKYLAVTHGHLTPCSGIFRDFLLRDCKERKTYVVPCGTQFAQEAVLSYRVIGYGKEISLTEIELKTGRTHQIRAQFSSRGFPLIGDRKYDTSSDDCQIGLWSYSLAFCHPYSGRPVSFTAEPPDIYPWNIF